jgi:hypothetical protein
MKGRSRNLIILAAPVLLLLLILVGVTTYMNHHRKLVVSSDKTPLTLQLNDTTYTVSKPKQSITLLPAVYNYRVKAPTDNGDVTLEGTIDLTEVKSKELNIRFGLYNKSAVSDALCATWSGDDECPYQPEYFTVQYFESYKWAVVTIKHPTLGTAFAVLQADNGSWNIEDGPGTDIKTGGYYPEAVEEAIKNAQS